MDIVTRARPRDDIIPLDMGEDTKKILGCLAGLALGDAMGRPTELLFNYNRIEKRYGRVEGLIGPDAGAVTDDTRLTLTVADAIIAKGGMVTADELVDHWKRHPEFTWRKFLRSYNRSEGFWIGEHIVAFAGRLGVPGHLTGYLNPSSAVAGNEAAMIMSPVGILFRGGPDEAADHARELSRATIVGPGAEVAAAWAAAISSAFVSDATTDSVIESARQSANTRTRGYIDRALWAAEGCADVFAARPDLYRGCLKSVPIDSRETIPVALAIFKLTDGDPMAAVIGGANFGRDSDTIAGMAGLLSGALRGIDAIDHDMYRKVCETNRIDLEWYAERLAGLRPKGGAGTKGSGDKEER